MTWLLHDRVLFRTTAALVVGIVLNMLAWTIGYLVFPDGFLRGATLASRLPLEQGESLSSMFVNIFMFNLLVAGGASAVINIFRVGNLPLSYVYVWGNWMLFGLFLGTNSFDIPRAVRLAPSLVSLLRSSGFYEIGAYTIIAVSTINLFQFRQKSWLNWETTRVHTWKEISLDRWELVAILCAVLVLVAANVWEAESIASFVL